MVEQEAVNFEVAGSSPAVGAIKTVRPFGLAFFIPRLLRLEPDFCEAKVVRCSERSEKVFIFFRERTEEPKAMSTVCHRFCFLQNEQAEEALADPFAEAKY